MCVEGSESWSGHEGAEGADKAPPLNHGLPFPHSTPQSSQKRGSLLRGDHQGAAEDLG